eukprot:139910_1
MRDSLRQKRQIFNKIRQDTNENTNANKFVTQIMNTDEKKQHDCDEEEEENITASYRFGVRFFYHQYYKTNQTKKEQVPGAFSDMIDYGNTFINPSYRYCDWYITPKHRTMKLEVLNS